MENLSTIEICALIIGLLLALAGFINTVGSAFERIMKVVRAAKAPNDRQDERLTALEEWRKEVDRKLRSDKDALDEIRDSLRVIRLAQFALLDHGIDGNNIEQMKQAKEAMREYLVNR